MKKLIIIILFALNLNPGGVNAQLLDYNIGDLWNGSNWVMLYRTNFYYDQNNTVDTAIYQNWMGSNWQNNTLFEYHNNAAAQPTLTLYKTWLAPSTWSNNTQIVNTYTTGNKPLLMTELTWNGTAYVNSQLQTNYYNSNLSPMMKTQQLWQGSSWDNWVEETYSCNAALQPTQTVVQIWNSVNNSFDNFARYTDTYNGSLMTARIHENWNAGWTVMFKYSYMYSGTVKTTELIETWNGSQWINNVVTNYTLNAANNPSVLIMQNWASTTWSNTLRTSFFYKNTAPVIVTNSVLNVSYANADVTADITSDGGATVLTRGICFSTSTTPTTSDFTTTVSGSLGSFTATLNGLSPVTTYYVRAFATNAVGNSYGNELTFTTLLDVGIREQELTSTRIFPNPVEDKLFLQSSELPENLNLVIYDLSGKILLSENSHQRSEPLDVRALKEGIYILEINGKANLRFQKM